MSTAPLRVVVVDDEPAARSYLVDLLHQHGGVEVVGEADDATSALRILHLDAVDAVFLDVRMPGLDGMDLARVLNRFDRAPAILFVTAYEEHAVDAFGVHALDYLLKPVDPARLADAVRRLHSHLATIIGAAPTSGPSDELTPSRRIESLDHGRPSDISIGIADVDADIDVRSSSVAAERSGSTVTASLAVDKGGRTVMIDPASVLYVEAAKDYCRLRTAHDSYLFRMPISTLEAAWLERGWIRVHRSHLVPVDAISELRRDPDRGWLVRLGRVELPVSRRHLPAVRERLHRAARALRGADTS
jgi:DNA-binding LytR/AlgR family response regulator